MRQLVIGSKGQVGSALLKVLERTRDVVVGVDVDSPLPEELFHVLHVCIPCSDSWAFAHIVRGYQAECMLPGGLTIIHSTVPIGMSCELSAVHSPIRGVHPNLYEGILIFVKFFGGARAEEAAEIFRQCLIRCETTPESRNTEAMKLWDTTYYGWNIVFQKAVKAYCDERGLDFDVVYRMANETYNEGYAALGLNNVGRPVLKDYPGKIGGHCVIPNAKLLRGDIAEFILEKNETYDEVKA